MSSSRNILPAGLADGLHQEHPVGAPLLVVDAVLRHRGRLGGGVLCRRDFHLGQRRPGGRLLELGGRAAAPPRSPLTPPCPLPGVRKPPACSRGFRVPEPLVPAGAACGRDFVLPAPSLARSAGRGFPDSAPRGDAPGPADSARDRSPAPFHATHRDGRRAKCGEAPGPARFPSLRFPPVEGVQEQACSSPTFVGLDHF